MSDVSISYKGAEIAALDDSGTKTLLTSGKYCEGDIEVAYTKPSGGGGAQLIASGTFTGDGGYTVNLPVGKKMPKTNFGFRLRMQPLTVFATDTTKFAAVGYYATIYSPDYFDFSANGKKYRQTVYSVSTDYNGTITQLSPVLSNVTVTFYRGASSISNQFANGNNAIAFTKADDGFTANITLWNQNNLFASGATYEWELLYFGSDPTNDIVEVP